MATEFAFLSGTFARIIRKREGRNWEVYIENVGDPRTARELVDLLNANEQVPPPSADAVNNFTFVADQEPSPIFEWDGSESVELQEFLGEDFKGFTNENVPGQLKDRVYVNFIDIFNEKFSCSGARYFIKLPEGIITYDKLRATS